MPDDTWGKYGPGSYVYDHEHDEDAHRAMIAHHVNTEHKVTQLRLTNLEKFEQRVIGGAIVMGALIGGGLIMYILHVLGVPV